MSVVVPVVMMLAVFGGYFLLALLRRPLSYLLAQLALALPLHFHFAVVMMLLRLHC